MLHAEVIQKNIDVLLRCTTINLYVIDFLRAKDVIDDAQESDLKAEGSHQKQLILLFQWLKVVSSDRYESFLQVMKDAEQEHVANLFTGSNEDDRLPLSDARYRRIVRIRYKMPNLTRIDNEVIAGLRKLQAISMTDAEEIRAENVDYAKVSKTISAIMKRSNYSYDSFQEVLRKTLQMAAAEYLNEGEMVTVHISNNRPDLAEPLSLAFNGVIRKRNTDDAEIQVLVGDMNGLGLNPVKAIPGQGIIVFIYCKTVHNAVNFTHFFNNKRLQHILENIFNRLLLTIEPNNTNELNSLIYLEDEEVTTLENFTGIKGWMMENVRRQGPAGYDATKQTEEHENRIRCQYNQLVNNLTSLQDIVAHMYQRHKLSAKELEHLQQFHATPIRASEELMNIIIRKPSDVYQCFLESLQKTRQHRVYQMLSSNQQSITTDEQLVFEHSRLIRQNYHWLTEYLDPDSGLLSLLFQKEVLNSREYEQIRLSSDRFKKNETLLSIISRKTPDDFKEFQKALIDRPTLQSDIVDKITFEKLQSRYNSEPKLMRTITTKASKEQYEPIHGMTILNDELFVINRKSSEIEVFHAEKLTFCGRWKMKHLSDPLDIAACNRNKRLYIMDYKGQNESKTIYVVSSHGKLVTNIRTGLDHGRLSVTDDSNVILTVFWTGKLNVYSADGQFLSEIILSADIVHPRHAIRLTNGDFVVSYGYFNKDVHAVCVVDINGEITKSYGGKRGSAAGEMNIPNYLAIDKEGFIFVADRINNRVLLLSPELKFEREILPKSTYSLQNTPRVFLDEPSSRLMVVNSYFDSANTHCGDGHILIYNMK